MFARMPPKPRLLILTPDFPPARGGIQLMAERLATLMGGFQARVLTLTTPGAGSYDSEHGLDVGRVGGVRLPASARAALLNLEALRAAAIFRPELVLAMHIVVSPAAAVIRRAGGVPSVQYFHAKEIGARPRLAAFAARQADVVIAVSQYTASLVAATGASARSVRLIPPGVDLPEDPSPEASTQPTILTIARLRETYKGHDNMVRAVALVRQKVPDVRWVVIGEGPLRAGLEQQARACGVAEAISFLGAVSEEERNAWLRRSDMLAMPSRDPGGGLAGEGFGIVFMEAAAYGKPVVAGSFGGALDAVSDGLTGLLVDPLSPPAIADAISSLLLDCALAARLGAAGRARAREFAWPAIAARLEAVLLEASRR
jgi:phosphatidylinositol alpha-1,6-mannosyltransferase